MTLITDILDYDQLLREVEAGYVRIQIHPEFPYLYIANYAEKTAFERRWNDVTRLTRGLIWNDKTLEVLARPFPKFFNFDEKEAPRVLDDQVVFSYSNKYDGSLGILYRRPDGYYAIATRGSFASEQAVLGTKLFNALPQEQAVQYIAAVQMGFTSLFEICGPDNRIVLKYEENFLAPLGYMSVADGYYVPMEGKPYATMRDLLGDLSRSNAEGWVVWKTAFQAVKIKQGDYVELHRIVTGLSEKEVWRQLRAGTYYDFVIKLPDEWQAWATGIADRLRAEFVEQYNLAELTASQIKHQKAKLPDRKAQALWIQQKVKPQYRGLVFSLLDGKDITDSIWKMLEPKGD